LVLGILVRPWPEPVPDLGVEEPLALTPGPSTLALAESAAELPADIRLVDPAELAAVPEDSTRAQIQWWDDERWASRDAHGEAWREEWLSVARSDPGRVPLELWLSILEWEPDDRRLWQSAERMARARSRALRRADLRNGDASAALLVEEAVEGARRRSDWRRGEDRPEADAWYRSLLRRLRGAFAGEGNGRSGEGG